MDTLNSAAKRRARRAKTSTRAAAARNTRNVTHVPDYRGRKFTPGGNPPDISLMPWNQVTLVHAGSDDKGVYKYTWQDILNELGKQLDPEGKAGKLDSSSMEVRIRSIRAWNVTGNQISLVVFDHSDTRETTLATMMDYSAKDSYASVGYEYPTSHQNIAISTNAKAAYTVVVAAKTSVIIYTSLLWKVIGIPKYTFSTELFIALVSDTSSIKSSSSKQTKLLEKINANSSSMVELLTRVEKNQPGLIEKIVNGVVHVGSYVEPFSALALDAEDPVVIKVLEALDQLKVSLDVPEIL